MYLAELEEDAEDNEVEDEDEDEGEDVSSLSNVPSTISFGVILTRSLGLIAFGSPTIDIWQSLVAAMLPGQQTNRALSA
jgi:hypothetical protein|eukprot:evm.model.NODE_6521_length_9922_cov_29.673452.1